MLDLAMLLLIGIAFAVAAGYVGLCARVLEPSSTHPDNPP